MQHIIRLFLIMLSALLFSGMTARAQATRDDISLRHALPSARSVALGEAFVGDVQDVSSAQWNPASLAFLENLTITGTQGYRMDDCLARVAIGAPILATERSTLALAGEYASFDDADWSQGQGKMPGLEASYAIRLLKPFSLGVIYNYRNAQFQGTHLESHTAGVGLMYSVYPSLTYGFSLTGLGSGLVARRHPDNHHTLVLEKESSIPRTVAFGASWRYPATHDRPVVALYLSNESISGESRLVYKLGAEFFPWKFLALRGGIISGPVTAVGRAGFGIRTGVVDIDYAVSSSVAAERLHYVTISIILPSH